MEGKFDKLSEKVSKCYGHDCSNVKENCNFFFEKQKPKIDEMIKNNYPTTKNYKKPKITDIKLVTMKHPETSCKLFNTKKQVKNVLQVGGAGKNSTSPLFSEAIKS